MLFGKGRTGEEEPGSLGWVLVAHHDDVSVSVGFIEPADHRRHTVGAFLEGFLREREVPGFLEIGLELAGFPVGEVLPHQAFPFVRQSPFGQVFVDLDRQLMASGDESGGLQCSFEWR